RPPTGLAAASTEHRAWSWVTIPALLMEMDCCSMASWMDTRSASFILSNSSIRHTPWRVCWSGGPPSPSFSTTTTTPNPDTLNPKPRPTRSARTRAPPSSVHSPVMASLCTEAVRPTAEAPLPVV
ncbi:hypothetical protein F751_0086, partial [Auxenochlorella protothecoides]